jgi:hypothetical protein
MMEHHWPWSLEEALHQRQCRLKATINDVEMVNVAAPEDESQASMPVGLFSGTEDDYIVHVGPLVKE